MARFRDSGSANRMTAFLPVIFCTASRPAVSRVSAQAMYTWSPWQENGSTWRRMATAAGIDRGHGRVNLDLVQVQQRLRRLTTHVRSTP